MGENDEREPSASAAGTTTERRRYGTVNTVTSETSLRSTSATPADAAGTDAAVAAERADVRVEELHDIPSLQAAADLYREVWQTDTRTAPVSPDLMRALSHAGGYVSGAYDGNRLVAASLAFHTGSAETGLHSHISAVLADVQGRDIGRALKLHQRAWALSHGLSTISWTYDPLLRRNAWFNITKLGARAVGYLVDFYGVMDDAQNIGDESDRAVALWSLDAPYVQEAAAGRRHEPDVQALIGNGAVMALHAEGAEPVAARIPDGARCVLVEVPADIQQMRLTDPALATRWRQSSRAILEPLLAGPYVATGFTRSGCYVLEEIAE